MAPPPTSTSTVWLNGELQLTEAARISPCDRGLTVGNGIFETLFAREGVPYAFHRHYTRLCKSAEVMGLEAPAAEVLRTALAEVLAANQLQRTPARLRITLTGGEAPLGSVGGGGAPTVLVAAAPTSAPSELVDVVIVPFTRNESGALAGVKSTSYGENVVALARAQAAGAGEAIFGNTQHQLCEGSGSNVFLVLDEQLVTPPLRSGCLPGVTRALVLELCAREGVPVVRTPVPLTALAGVQEAFLTSTLRKVQAIRAVDGIELGEAPGELTRQVRELFEAWAAKEVDP